MAQLTGQMAKVQQNVTELQTDMASTGRGTEQCVSWRGLPCQNCPACAGEPTVNALCANVQLMAKVADKQADMQQRIDTYISQRCFNVKIVKSWKERIVGSY